MAGLAAILVMFLGGWQILRTRDAMLTAAERDAQNLTRSLAQHAARTIDGVDLMLSGAVDRVQNDPTAAGLSAFLSRRTGSLNQLRRIAVTDQIGDWIADSLPPHEPRSSSIHPEFAWHRDHLTSDLHIEMMRHSRYDGALVIPLSKRWNTPDGSFAGIVSAGLTPTYFEAFYGTVKIGKRGTVALWSDDGHLFVRHPQIEGFQQSSASVNAQSALFSSRSGVVRSRSPFDGVERIFAYEHIDTYPLVVSAAISVDEALSSWRREAWIEGGVIGMAVLALFTLGVGLERHRRRLLVTKQQVLKQSALLQTTLDNMDQALVKIGSNGKLDLFNRRFVELFSIPPFLLQDPDLEFEQVLAYLLEAGEYGHTDQDFQARVAQRGAPLTLGTYERNRPDGTRLEVHTISVPGGAVVRTYSDVTERHQAELARRDIEARYRLLADNSSDMITHMDLTGRRLFVSPGARELVGYEPEELVGTLRTAFVHPDDEAGLKQKIDDLVAGRTHRVANINRIRHKDGWWIWIEASVKLLRDAEGQPCGFVSALRDITDRKLADEAMRASEARYRLLAETTTDLIMQLDLSMQRQYVSPACRRLLSFEPEEMLGREPLAEVHPDDADDVRALAARLVAGEVEGDSAVTTYRVSHKSGRWLWVEAGLNLLRDEATGAPVSLICSLRDVTERQRVAKHLERAKAAAEQASRAKADFVANMSHELRTPLTGILGVHDLLRQDPSLGKTQRRLVDLASDAGTSLLDIVNDVLDFSKIEAGHLTIESVPFSLDEMIEGCRELALNDLKGKPIEIRAILHPAVPRRLAGDPTRLRQILLNLLTNAIKFTERGKVVIRVGYTFDTSTLRISVSDTGMGIPLDRAAHLFDRFTQADTSMTRRFGGTGLGLAICKRLTELMGGSIGADAIPEGGSCFWFEVPLDVCEQPRGERMEESGRPTPRNGHRLLLAEDHAMNAEIISAMLVARGHQVTVVSNGAEAVHTIHQGSQFDLVLMDMQMPVMDGITATAAIRSFQTSSDNQRVPIIGLTANALAEDATSCVAAGMDAHVAKPVVWDELFTTIDRLVHVLP